MKKKIKITAGKLGKNRTFTKNTNLTKGTEVSLNSSDIVEIERDRFIPCSLVRKIEKINFNTETIVSNETFQRRIKNSATFNSTIINGRIVVPTENKYLKAKVHITSSEYGRAMKKAMSKYNSLISED